MLDDAAKTTKTKEVTEPSPSKAAPSTDLESGSHHGSVGSRDRYTGFWVLCHRPFRPSKSFENLVGHRHGGVCYRDLLYQRPLAKVVETAVDADGGNLTVVIGVF